MDNNLLIKYKELLGYQDLPLFLRKYLEVPSLLRLKNIGYFCGMDHASKEIYDFKEYVSRYDHSLTTSLITWKFTKDKRATLAALFHDISTPCFSHVIDYMNKDYIIQESTEEKTLQIMENDSYLLECLSTDGFLVSDIADFKKYSIVDLKRPMLCADRLDGVILTGLFWTKSISFYKVSDIISNLDIFINEFGQKEIGFSDKEICDFVVGANNLIDLYCHSKEDNYMMELLAKITKRAIDIRLISYDDLFILDEGEIIRRFNNCDDIYLLNDFNLFKTISLSDIPFFDMPNIKTRSLNPIVCGNRFK